MTEASDATLPPPGEYAIVELFGHTTLVGRVEEVERFGAKMLAIEPLFRDVLLPAVFHGGAAIYRFTPCTPAVAHTRQPRRAYQLPDAIRCIVPAPLLAAPETSAVYDYAEPDQDEDEEAV